MAQCSTVRDNGYPCINNAQRGKDVCVTHDPYWQCGKPTAKGTPCKRPRQLGLRTCSKHK